MLSGNFKDANFKGADLDSVQMAYANLDGTDLASADLDDAEASSAQLADANLTDATLTSSTVSSASFNGSVLDGANFSDAAMTYTDLSDAIIKDANFTGAGWSQVTDEGAVWSNSTCPDGTNSNKYVDGCLSPLDTTPPVVTVTGVSNHGQYVLGATPKPGCRTTDNSVVATPAALKVTTTGAHGVGAFTATCAGAVDQAGNEQAAPVSATYTVLYGFGGFSSPVAGSTISRSARKITVRFRLTNAASKAIATGIDSSLGRARKVRVTLAGHGITAVTVFCSWSAKAREFSCTIKIPAGVRAGRSFRYTLTASENLGTGFTRVPKAGKAANPETIHFK